MIEFDAKVKAHIETRVRRGERQVRMICDRCWRVRWLSKLFEWKRHCVRWDGPDGQFVTAEVSHE